MVITFLNEISEEVGPNSSMAAIRSLRGCDRGDVLTNALLKSRKEDAGLEDAKWE